MKSLWEILVPTTSNEGKPFRLRYHRVWDKKIREISGGLTIMPVAKGQWVHTGTNYEERMIPVRLMATKEEMESVAKFTLKYYNQIAVFYYKLSDCVHIYEN